MDIRLYLGSTNLENNKAMLIQCARSIWLPILLALNLGVVNAQAPTEAEKCFGMAQQAFLAKDYDKCLEELGRAEAAYGAVSIPMTFLRLQALDKKFVALQPTSRSRVAVQQLVGQCEQFVRDNSIIKYEDEAAAVERIRATWAAVLPGMPVEVEQPTSEQLAKLRLQEEERTAAIRAADELKALEQLFELESAIDGDDPVRVAEALTGMAALVRPLPSGRTALNKCIEKDALNAFKLVEGHMKAHPDTSAVVKLSPSVLLTKAIVQDAPRLTEYLMAGRIASTIRVEDERTSSPLELALEKNSERVLDMFYSSSLDLGLWESRLTKKPALADGLFQRLRSKAFEQKSIDHFVVALRVRPAKEELTDLVFQCIEHGTEEMLSKVLEQAPLDLPNERGQTYVHYAIELDKPEIVLALLLAGFSDDAPDADGCPPGHYLLTRDVPRVLANSEVVGRLDLNAPDTAGIFLIQKIIFKRPEAGTAQLLDDLLNNNPDMNVNMPGPNDWTPLHYAARERRTDLVKVMVKHKARELVVDRWGRTAKDVAKEKGFRDVVTALH